jgi:phospholipase/carboxylesterase
MGFSQGAIMSHSILNSTPALLAGVAAMSGRMIPELFEDAAPRETMKDFPLLVTHGTHDGVIPIQEGRAIKAHYEALPVALEYHEFEMAHEINQQALNTILNWLEQRLNDQKT